MQKKKKTENTSISPQELLQYLATGACCITPTNRLSQELLREYFAGQGRKCVAKPSLYPYSLFLTTMFSLYQKTSSLSSTRRLFTKTLLRESWIKVLSQELPTVSKGLVEAVEEAYNRCKQSGVDIGHPAFAYTEQTQFFQNMVQKFEKMLLSLNAIIERDVVPFLIEQQYVFPFPTLIFAAFDDYTQEQITLQEYVQSKGCKVLHWDIAEKEKKGLLLQAEDSKEENNALLQWLLQQRAQDQRRIGIVVPDLEISGKSLTHLLAAHLPPDSYDISLGTALSTFPLVSHAFQWLSLNTTCISQQQAQLLLHSPFIGFSRQEFAKRSQLLQDCTLLQEDDIDFSIFLSTLRTKSPALYALLQKISSFPAKASITAWSNHYRERLQSLLFPGEYSLDSATYQVYQRFLQLLLEWEELQCISPVFTQKEALQALQRLLTATIFQVQKKKPQIEILGLLEAAGTSFDSLWVKGMSDKCLPKKVQLSPFIPVSLQKELGLPYALPQKELLLAEKQIQRLRNSSPQTIFSFSRLSEDTPQLPSPVLGALPPYIPLTLAEQESPNRLLYLQEKYQVPLPAQTIRGSTALLANQAKCPFKAFARHRLHAKPTTTPCIGWSPEERGRLMHKIMELLWQQLQNQATLLQMEDASLQTYIKDIIIQALSLIEEERGYPLSPIIKDLEKERLISLVHAALHKDKERPPFEIVALEKEYTYSLPGVLFSVRVDRIDKDKDEGLWVVDYKSSPPSQLPWQAVRPKEPQILLYALLQESIDTISFLILKNGEATWKGVSGKKIDVPGIKYISQEEPWLSYKQKWQEELTLLAEEFVQGHCPPTPLSPSICVQCAFKSICRIE